MDQEPATWPEPNCDAIDKGDTAFVAVSAMLVLLMTPGIAFFYGGLVHRHSVLSIMMQCFMSIGLISLLWTVVGFSLAFGESAGGFIGSPASYAMLTNLDPCTPAGYPMREGQGLIPGMLFAAYQMMIAILAPAIITGSFTERVRFPAYLVFICLWLLCVYCPFAHWVWSPKGFLRTWGVHDFAGGIVVHIAAGNASLASLFVVGSRRYVNEEERKRLQVPHNRAFVALGSALLWFGWMGFNGGSAFAAGGQAVFAVVNTTLSAGTSMVAWMTVEWIWHGKPTMLGACMGAVSGLAIITSASGYVRPWASVVMGALAGGGCQWCVWFIKDRLRWDDALDVWGVHAIGGAVGTIMLGFMADETVGGVARSWRLFGIQIASVILASVWAFVVSIGLLLFVNLITPVVPAEMENKMGLDKSMHGEYAYDEEEDHEKIRSVSVDMPSAEALAKQLGFMRRPGPTAMEVLNQTFQGGRYHPDFTTVSNRSMRSVENGNSAGRTPDQSVRTGAVVTKPPPPSIPADELDDDTPVGGVGVFANLQHAHHHGGGAPHRGSQNKHPTPAPGGASGSSHRKHARGTGDSHVQIQTLIDTLAAGGLAGGAKGGMWPDTNSAPPDGAGGSGHGSVPPARGSGTAC